VKNDETFTDLPPCREVVSSDDPTATYAVERVVIPALDERHVADRWAATPRALLPGRGRLRATPATDLGAFVA
jgi:hypothetical protein